MIIKKRQIKTVIKLHYIAIRMAKMKKSDKILRADKDVEQLEFSFIVDRMKNSRPTSENSKKMKRYVHTNNYMWMHRGSFMIAEYISECYISHKLGEKSPINWLMGNQIKYIHTMKK